MKGLRWRRASTLEEANAYLASEFLPEWNRRFSVTPNNATDAHRALGVEHYLPAILSHVEQRTIGNDYTLQFRGQRYQIANSSLQVGMRGEKIRVEARLDGRLAFRYRGQYVAAGVCLEAPPPAPQKPATERSQGPQSRRSQPMDERFPSRRSARSVAEHSRCRLRQLKPIPLGAPGKLRPPIFALTRSRPQLGSFTTVIRYRKPSDRSQRVVADHCGASPSPRP